MISECKKSRKRKNTDDDICWFADHLKTAVHQMLLLEAFAQGEQCVAGVEQYINDNNHGFFQIQTPYKAITRMQVYGYITKTELKKGNSGRAKQYYKITNNGIQYLTEMRKVYQDVFDGTNMVLGKSKFDSDSEYENIKTMRKI